MALESLSADCSTAQINEAMARDGACIVENLLPSETVDAITADIAPWIEKANYGEDEFVGRRTKRAGALIARCPSTHPVVMHPLVLEAANLLLRPYCERIQLHLTQVIDIFPDSPAQLLHRDRLAWGGFLPKPIEPQFNTIWALTDFTEENGATHLAPGSHLWDLDQETTPDQTVQAVMPRGSVLLYSGTVIHGGGANRSAAPRVGMNITYCLSWLRQEENQFLSCPPSIAKDLPSELTDLMGYTMANYALGYYSQPEGIEGVPDTTPPERVLGREPGTSFG
jgi:ectoine hydroxylase-related dioxygenase (phytanoyl-CoA dioxygenase family)